MFNADAVARCLEMGPNYQTRGFDLIIWRNITSIYKKDLILEYWGTIDRNCR